MLQYRLTGGLLRLTSLIVLFGLLGPGAIPGPVAASSAGKGHLVGRPGVALEPYPVTLVSAPYPGAPAHPPGLAYSYAPAISADGRYVVFFSNSDRLVPGDTNNTLDVFLRDLTLGTTTRISGASGIVTQYSAGDLRVADLSADGRYVTFSGPDGLAPGDNNGFVDVLVYDQVSGQYERVSQASNGTAGDGSSWGPSISADGRYVTFLTMARNLVTGHAYGDNVTVMLHDRQTHTTTPVSLDLFDTIMGGTCPSISANGQYVAFNGNAPPFVGGASSIHSDVIVLERATGTFSRASVNSAQVPGNDNSACATLSADGRYVAFGSEASNLVPNDTNLAPDVFVRDRVSGTTWRVSVSSEGVAGDRRSDPGYTPAISADGRFVTFASEATNLVPGDTNNYCGNNSLDNCQDIFLHDSSTGETMRVSLAANGDQSNNSSAETDISGDGRVIVFNSEAYNLVPADTFPDSDIYAVARPVSIFLPLVQRSN